MILILALHFFRKNLTNRKESDFLPLVKNGVSESVNLMKTNLLFIMFSLLFWSLSFTFAQEDHEKKDSDKVKDPTEMSENLRKALEGETPSVRPATVEKTEAVVTEIKPPKIPQLQLKAKMLVPGRAGLAFLEIDQQLYMVTEGDILTQSSKESPQPVTLHIKEISAQKVEIFLEPFQKVLVLR